MVELEYQENVPISPRGTPFTSVQMAKLKYVNSITIIELQIKMAIDN